MLLSHYASHITGKAFFEKTSYDYYLFKVMTLTFYYISKSTKPESVYASM